MPFIAKITQQKKNKQRFNIYLKEENGSEKYAFSVDEDILVRLKLAKGIEIDDLAIMEVQYQDHVQKAFQSAVSYLSYKMRSEKEIRAYLTEKEWEPAVVDEVLHKLRKYQYVNDEEYASSYVRTQVNVGKKGPDLIKRELDEKGIPNELAMRALEQYTEETQQENAEEWATKLLGKSKGSLKDAKQKAIMGIMRKGYSMEMAKRVTDKLSEVNEEEEWQNLLQTARKFERKYGQLDDFQYTQKMKSALFRKGFEMDLINRFIENGRNEIE